jgi:hypothetical protein
MKLNSKIILMTEFLQISMKSHNFLCVKSINTVFYEQQKEKMV